MELSLESRRLSDEANKIGVHRQYMNKGTDTYTETDWSLIYRMYCVYFNTMPHRMWFWSPTGEIHGVLVTMTQGTML